MDKTYDYCNLAGVSKVTGEFDNDESILLSYELKKINDYGKSQGRTLVITNKRVYNLAGKKIKRAIKVSDITAMTKNNAEKNLEFIIHVSSESDYRFKIDKLGVRDEIFSVLKQAFADVSK